MSVQRQNCLVTSKFLAARELLSYLKAKRCDVVIVTRFAVQVHPDSVARAEEAIWSYEPDWRADGRYKTA